MTTNALAQAIARHTAAQAAVDAAADPDDCPEHLREEENEALDELSWTPCASDAEFLRKAALPIRSASSNMGVTGQWR
jgi:hypothetical protein